MNSQEIRKVLFEVEELAGKSQGLWDNAWTNAVIADHPDKEGYTQQTYQATHIHAECMDVLRMLLSKLQSEGLESVEQQAKTFAAEVKLGRIKWTD